MTEAQRDYLADLAGKKGVKLENTEEKSVAWASAKIEELKAMPDAEFDELDASKFKYTDELIDKVKKELGKWTFQK